MTDQLHSAPNWTYLLREFDTLYRHGSAGGSRPVRSHRKRVREKIAGLLDRDPPFYHREPENKPVVEHLGRAFDLAETTVMRGLSRALSRVSHQLTWEYGYERLPKTLEKKFAYCEVVGPKGPIVNDTLILGFVLFAPKTTYPQHSHQEIEESYISIAGAWSENDTAVYAPGSLILNRTDQKHRITTGDIDPCLLAYAWVGPAERLSAPGMKFSPSRKTAGK